MSKIRFNYIIGNPPYQADTVGENKKFAAPVYHKFMDMAYRVGEKVELITPARFLFNAGSTPKAWNEKMLNDPYFKVLQYESNSDGMFPSTNIAAGVAITYRDKDKTNKPILVFTENNILQNIIQKVDTFKGKGKLTDIIYIQNKFNLDILLKKHPEYKPSIGSNGTDDRLEKNIFLKIPIFTSSKQEKNDIQIIGIRNQKRTALYIPSVYINQAHDNLHKYKIIVPVANPPGFGEKLSPCVIGEPNVGYTRSFIGIGAFNDKKEAECVLKYIKGKFARTMLSLLKATQMTNKEVWKLIPLQDFSSSSDIDWSKSIPEIDKQLYTKYNLTPDEIEFIEKNVKPME